jgi:transglutaminase-like putative cysteine protease
MVVWCPVGPPQQRRAALTRWQHMRLSLLADLAYDFARPCETLLLLEPARDADQVVLSEHLSIDPSPQITRLDDPWSGERRVVFSAAGKTRIAYEATVDVARTAAPLAGLGAAAIRELPPDALRFLRPSRYCPSDRFERFVRREFGRLEGGDRVAAILDWIAGHVDYAPGVSDSATTALDTFADRAGVCRDFAHLAVALCRAGDIPARVVSAFAWNLSPQDLHAVAEVYVGARWRLVDPTGRAPVEGLVRIATGADAADVAFLSVFGEATLCAQTFSVARLDADVRDAA